MTSDRQRAPLKHSCRWLENCFKIKNYGQKEPSHFRGYMMKINFNCFNFLIDVKRLLWVVPLTSS